MQKKVLLVGASGTIGQAIQNELQPDCSIITVGSKTGVLQVDLDSSASITNLYQQAQDIDAVVCTAARGIVFAPLAEMDQSKVISSMQSKLLGQIDLVTQGIKYLKDDVSFTLTTGILNRDPIASGTAAAMVNGAIDSFVRAAAIDMPARQRINAISPTLLQESQQKYRDFFPGYPTVPAVRVATAYRKSIFGSQTGQIIEVL